MLNARIDGKKDLEQPNSNRCILSNVFDSLMILFQDLEMFSFGEFQLFQNYYVFLLWYLIHK